MDIEDIIRAELQKMRALNAQSYTAQAAMLGVPMQTLYAFVTGTRPLDAGLRFAIRAHYPQLIPTLINWALGLPMATLPAREEEPLGKPA